MNVLVTGGAGLIGMALRKALAARGHAVTAIDITDFGRGDADLKFLGLEDRAGLEGLGSGQALTMPEIAEIARKAVPGADGVRRFAHRARPRLAPATRPLQRPQILLAGDRGRPRRAIGARGSHASRNASVRYSSDEAHG